MSESMALKKVSEFESHLQGHKQWVSVVKEKINPLIVMRSFSMELTRNPGLAECTLESLYNCFLFSVQLGLSPSPIEKEFYMLPFKNKNIGGKKEAIPVVGYQGYIKLCLQHPDVLDVMAFSVRDGDYFDAQLGTEYKIDHQPQWDSDGDPTKITHVYAVAWMKNGTKKFVVLTRAEVERVRKRSPAERAVDKSTNPWTTGWEAMALKTAIKRLMRWVPKATTTSRAIAAEEKIEREESYTDVIELPSDAITDKTPATGGTKALKERIKTTVSDPTPAPPPENAATGDLDSSGDNVEIPDGDPDELFKDEM